MAQKSTSPIPVQLSFAQKLTKFFHWLDDHAVLLISTFLLLFIPLYPKIPLFDILPGYIVRVRLEDAFIAMAGAVWLIQLYRKKVTWKSPLFASIGIYATVGFLSLLSGIFLLNTIPLQLLHIGKSALHLFRYMEYFFLFVMMYSALKTPKQAKVVLWALALSVAAITFYGIGQRYWYWPVYSTMNREFSKGMRLYLTEHARVQSTFGGHYDLGAFLVVVLPILLAFMYRSKKRWEKWALFAAHTLGLWLLIVSASRAPFAAYGVAAGLVIVLTSLAEASWKQKLGTFLKRFISFSLVFGLLFIRFGQDMHERFLHVLEGYPQAAKVYAQIEVQEKRFIQEAQKLFGIIVSGPPKNSIGFDNSESVLTPTDELPTPDRPTDVYEDIPDLVKVATTSADGTETIVIVEQPRTWSPNALRYGLSMAIRLDTLWPNAVRGFMRNPLLGSGYATLNKESNAQFLEADSTDNNFLRVLGETGLLGFISFFGIIALVLRQCAKYVFNANGLKAAIAAGLMAGTIGLLINALYIDVYAASKVAFTYWALTGFAFAIFSLRTPKPKKTISKPKRIRFR